MSSFEYVFEGLFLKDIVDDIQEEFPQYSVTVFNAASQIVVNFVAEEALTPEQYALLVGVVDAYDYQAHLLTQTKNVKNTAIDSKTQKLIAGGFTFGGKIFSLSIPAQVSWLGLYTFKDMLTYPYPVTTLDDATYLVQSADDMSTFAVTGVSAIDTHKTSGRILKAEVNACTTIAEVIAIVDDRT